jgi:hypothetical protein
MRSDNWVLTDYARGDTMPMCIAIRARLCQALNLPDVVLFSTMPMHIDTAPVEAAS